MWKDSINPNKLMFEKAIFYVFIVAVIKSARYAPNPFKK